MSDKKNIDGKEKTVEPQANPEITKDEQFAKIEKQVKAIIEKGKKKGFLTYEEVNDDLPEDAISPARLDQLLATLDEMGIKLVDESDLEGEDDQFEAVDIDEDEEIPDEGGIEDEEVLEREIVSESRRIDDPIRMYLTQMGEIPLLSRDDEIRLARKIELSRMAFRRKMLENDYCARNSVEILRQVQDGDLSFDRTMKISTSENLIRSVIKKRLPQNLKTVDALMSINRDLFNISLKTTEANELKRLLKKQHRNKRKIATLLEELSLRTSRIQPAKTKLRGICEKMHNLERAITEGPNREYAVEDIESMKQEL
ncbi:MAG: RNA polymerase sigma factor region1.1 domain-containing protein, partial [Phycisphaerae bacterium]|nr:RNA polymerase sigma factor region1.1 domain-containing protein [Phycisphaerae bacterium]